MENLDKKRSIIIAAALKRFAHFGLAKTTMTEIAADISYSKALLNYYFPDKISLYAAVMDHILNIMEEDIQKGLSKKKTGHSAILFYLEKRQEFVRKYYNLLEVNKITGPEIPADLKNIFDRALDSEQRTLTQIFSSAKVKGEFNIQDPAITAEIFLQALFGIRIYVRLRQNNFIPDQNQFESVLLKEKQLAHIFIKGIE